jgi:hypothetical protein
MRVTHPTPIAGHAPRRRALVTAILGAALLMASLGSVGAQASPPPAADPAAISYWNDIAVKVITIDAGKANAEGFMWLGFTQAAVYNAVVGITRDYKLYKWHAHARKHASPEAAAGAAAFGVLMEYFGANPAAVLRLNAAYAAALLVIPDGKSKDRGIAFGERAAARLTHLREGDGRGAVLPPLPPPGPGIWRPTPTAEAPFFDPWLAQLRPLMLRSPSQYRSRAPFKLTSRRYAKELNEVQKMGSIGSTDRTPEQTATALFISGATFGVAGAALRDLSARRHLSIGKAARLFAAVDMSMADAIVVAWDAKYHFHFWRPITAIRLADTDDNPLTVADPLWTPLLATPPYPDWTSGLCSIMGAATRAVSRVMGTSRIDLNIPSSATMTTRHYEWASDLMRDSIDARVWSGIHFRTADVLAAKGGKKVGDYALDHYFKRIHHHHDD